MDLLVVGAGYAGLVTAACLADSGHTVTSLDTDPERVQMLRAGRSPIYEPGLSELLERSIAASRLRFESDYSAIARGSFRAAFVVVGTPPQEDGTVDMQHLDEAVEGLAPAFDGSEVLVVKSTVPVGTAARVRERMAALRPDVAIEVASNPEFLRQGSAVRDFLHPDRIVIGTASEAATSVMREVYAPSIEAGVPVVYTSLESAELIKYAANAFLATKLSFINEIADLCEVAGASVADVSLGVGLDHRIGPHYFSAGPGFGGSCLPKDVQALVQTSRGFGAGSRIVGAALDVNTERVARMVDRVATAAGGLDDRTVALLGLTFKADTDDLRESPAMYIVRELLRREATVRVYDPQGMDGARRELGDAVTYAVDEYDAASGADVVVIATEWKQFGSMSLPKLSDALRAPVVVDLRNMWDPAAMAAAGFRYHAIGRPDPA